MTDRDRQTHHQLFLVGLRRSGERGFTAFVLEAMGTGAAATKYNVFASISNTPIYFMTLVDGWAHTKWGPAGMLNTEAVICLLGMVLFLAFAALVNRVKPPTLAAPQGAVT